MMNMPVIEYPKPWAALWIADISVVTYVAFVLYRRWRSWSRGMDLQALPERDRAKVARIWVSEVFLQRQLLDLSFSRWLGHMGVFWGFAALMVLSLSTSVLRMLTRWDLDGGLGYYFFHADGYIIIKLWGNAFGLMLLCGLLFALIRRLLVRPAQLDNKEADLSLLFLLLWLTLSGFALEALRLSLAPVEVGQYSFVSNLMAARGNYTPVELTPWLTALWTIHGLSGVALVAYVPHSKLMHSILAPLVLALNAQAEHKRKDLYWPGTARHRAIRSREI